MRLGWFTSRLAGRRRRLNRRLNLALQGGGAYGAFTWGVLDSLLEDERVDIGAVSGTSAGAVNAVALASGLATGGRAEARAVLERVWRDVSHLSGHNGLLDSMLSPWRWADAGLGMVSRMLSPYQFNPMNVNPLRGVLDHNIDFDAIRTRSLPGLYIAATDVRTGECRLFADAEIDARAVLASCCLPQLFHAVEIDGRHYWDGGFTANPAITPLMVREAAGDTLIVELAGPANAQLPYDAREIGDRVQRLMFSQPLRRELSWIAEARRNRDVNLGAGVHARRLRRHRLHMISADLEANGADPGGPMKADWIRIRDLRDRGRAAACEWMNDHLADVGRRETAPIGAANNRILSRKSAQTPTQPAVP